MTVPADWEDWRQARMRNLAGPDSWFGLVGLYWLEPGDNPVGSAEDALVRLPAGPAHLGVLAWEEGALIWRPAPAAGAGVENEAGRSGDAFLLATDAAGEPSRVHCGELVFFVIEREGRLAVRVRDRAWQEKQAFTGIESFAHDPAWRIEAAWSELSPPVQLELPNVTGGLRTVIISRQATFRVGDKQLALLPVENEGDSAFFVFRDATSGKETYGGGRFLQAAISGGDTVVLDFNFAYNPPCAFSAFATCPLPPPENWLPVAIRAGEKKYSRDK